MKTSRRPRVHDRQRAGRAGGERVERRDARDRQLERQRQPARRREAEPQPGEAPGPGADDDPGQLRALGAARAQQLVGVLEHATARETRSPSTSPSRTSALVAALVAVSNASVSTPGDTVEQ